MKKKDDLSDSEYDLSSDYDTTENEEVIIRSKKNNLLNSHIIDYSSLKCASCEADDITKKSNFLIIIFAFLIIFIVYFCFKRN